MKYTGLPVGTKITVTETGVANYKGSVSVVLNGVLQQLIQQQNIMLISKQ